MMYDMVSYDDFTKVFRDGGKGAKWYDWRGRGMA